MNNLYSLGSIKDNKTKKKMAKGNTLFTFSQAIIKAGLENFRNSYAATKDLDGFREKSFKSRFWMQSMIVATSPVWFNCMLVEVVICFSINRSLLFYWMPKIRSMIHNFT